MKSCFKIPHNLHQDSFPRYQDGAAEAHHGQESKVPLPCHQPISVKSGTARRTLSTCFFPRRASVISSRSPPSPSSWRLTCEDLESSWACRISKSIVADWLSVYAIDAEQANCRCGTKYFGGSNGSKAADLRRSRCQQLQAELRSGLHWQASPCGSAGPVPRENICQIR